MASGKVKWFDNKRGFGFIVHEAGKDVFVHHTSIMGEGYRTLIEGEVVHFELVNSEKGPKAQNVLRPQHLAGLNDPRVFSRKFRVSFCFDVLAGCA